MTFNDLRALDEIATPFFDMTIDLARRKAALSTLPVPAFRLSPVNRGPYYVTQEALDAYVVKQAEAAAKLHRQMAHA